MRSPLARTPRTPSTTTLELTVYDTHFIASCRKASKKSNVVRASNMVFNFWYNPLLAN